MKPQPEGSDDVAASDSGAELPRFPSDLAGAFSSLDPEILRHFAQYETRDPAAAPDLSPPPERRVAPEPAVGEQLEELADDMLVLLKRVKTLEERQTETLSHLQQVQAAIAQAADTAARESDALRRELLGERKHIAQMSAFLAVVTGLERLQAMRAELNRKRDARTVDQLDAVLQTLTTVLRTLGFVEFRAEVNEPFNPTRMECLGYVPGEPDVVLKCVRSGFLSDQTVVRPAGVLISHTHENTGSNPS